MAPDTATSGGQGTAPKRDKNEDVEAKRTALGDQHANGEITDEEFYEQDQRLRAQLS